ncbi:uncharacterized protein EAF02_009075 [Botrytis sinoallii]|uniref:uncharacterized protein n=1 Tax=Botrytis sinoallii TaxID=1463999 RepID=UPI001901B6F4|nr:uncharacterized protein EAF02_009075 [Botrytis sinoallii]KAF7871970.1 hypothetical protein EAF02_009075 [Botrytis sinoallii]
MFLQLITTLLLLLPLTWGGRNIYKLYQNYILAKKIGVLIIILTLSPQNPIWMLLADIIVPLFQKLSITRSWPLIRFGRRAWEFKDKAQIHLEIGDIFIMVTPDKNILYICDADTLSEVLLRRNEFKRPREVLEMLNVFGPNISTVPDEDWPRHKKATGPPFSNEQTNNLVWQEALRQTQEMMHYWIDQRELALRTTAEDAKTFSLNILTSAGLGKSYSFKPSSNIDNDPGHAMSYKESLSLIVGSAIPILIIGPNFLLKRIRYLPKLLQNIAQATVEFKAYMKEMVREERELIAKGKQSKPNLMTSLIRASQSSSEFKTDDMDPRSKQSGLSESEIFGNMFVFNFAGHDTISHTLCYALNLLAAHPTVQDWISEEVNAVFLDSDASTWDYADSFPKLKYCMAVMLETLRLYHPLVTFTKSTGNFPTTVTYDSKELNLPPNIMILPNLLGIQAHPRYWGPDRLLWGPFRWIIASSNQNGELTEELWTPPKGSYMPWSEGPRGCPGKKFGQVEFVAAMAGLFYRHRVEIVKEGGENQEEAEKRVKAFVDDSAMVLLLQMMHPEKAGLRWVRKG